MTAEKRAILRKVRVFAGLDDADCDAVLTVLRARRGAPGDTLFAEGDRGDSLVIVLDGELVASVRTGSGSPEVVARLGPGEVVGEMALLDQEPRSATVSTPNGATILELGREGLTQLGHAAPRALAAIHRNILGDLARRLRDAGEKLSDGAGGGPPASIRNPAIGDGRRARAVTSADLRSLPALASRSDEDLDLLAYIGGLCTFEAGESLMTEGEEGRACFLVVAGSVAVTRKATARGGEPIARLGPGALVGQLALIDRAPRSASVTAEGRSLALEIDAKAFAKLVTSAAPIALRFQWQVAQAGVKQLRGATRRMAEAATERASLTGSMREWGAQDGWDDWEADAPGPAIELDIDPASLRRR